MLRPILGQPLGHIQQDLRIAPLEDHFKDTLPEIHVILDQHAQLVNIQVILQRDKGQQQSVLLVAELGLAVFQGGVLAVAAKGSADVRPGVDLPVLPLPLF